MGSKELLRKLGEETIFSAKGHFKACDVRRQMITSTIWLCAVVNVIGIVGLHPNIDTWLSVTGLLGTIGLLIWNEGEGKDYRAKHKEVAERYLALHKEIRSCYFLSDYSVNLISSLADKVSALDQSPKPDIPKIARVLSKRAIERKKETDNWFYE